MSANRQFQKAWNHLIKGLYVRKNRHKTGILAYSQRMQEQIQLAGSYGPIGLTIMGDSNAENLASYRYMKKFDRFGISLNLAVAGSRADEWLYFFAKTETGHQIYQKIHTTKILWNIGGNHILQNRMDNLESSLKGLKKLFPHSFNCLVPPIWTRFLQYSSQQIEWNHRIKLCNSYIQDIWQQRAIDTYSPFVNQNTGEPHILTHKDPVHFSKYGNAVRIPIILYHLLKFD